MILLQSLMESRSRISMLITCMTACFSSSRCSKGGGKKSALSKNHINKFRLMYDSNSSC